MVLHLPPNLAELIRFPRLKGWRRGEAVGLLWSQIERDDDRFPGQHENPVPGTAACVRIGEAQTKGGDARAYPIADAIELRDLWLARWRPRKGLHVFHRNGMPIGDFRKAWERACKAAGLEGQLVHDVRRTAARDFRRAAVSEGEIMRLCGWKTRDMFDRYNIIDQADLTRAVARRLSSVSNVWSENGKGTAQIPPNKVGAR